MTKPFLRRNPIKGLGKYEGELYAARYAHENPDDELGKNARVLAEMEIKARSKGYRFEWENDEIDSSDFSDENFVARKNPSVNVRAAKSSPAFRARIRKSASEKYRRVARRGKSRFSLEGGTLGDANYFIVQVRRKNNWITLAGFPRGEFGKAQALDYAHALAARYPAKKMRVIWPDPPRKK